MPGWGEQAAARHSGVGSGVLNPRIGKPVQRHAGEPGQAAVALAALAHGIGQCDQVVLVGMGGQRAGVPHEVPSAGCGDPAGMGDAQIP